MDMDNLRHSIEEVIISLESIKTNQEALYMLGEWIVSIYDDMIINSPYCVHPEKRCSEVCNSISCEKCKDIKLKLIKIRIENKLKELHSGNKI